jgi:hypothetical protein
MLERTAATAGGVVFTVSVAGVPGGVELGLIAHVGASAGAGVTTQVRLTLLKKPPGAGTTLIVEVEDPPAFTVAGVSGVAESEKSESNVAPTLWSVFMVTLHVLVPVQPPLQPTKLEPVAGVAVSVTMVPEVKKPSQLLVQFSPLPVTVPLPNNATNRE